MEEARFSYHKLGASAQELEGCGEYHAGWTAVDCWEGIGDVETSRGGDAWSSPGGGESPEVFLMMEECVLHLLQVE
jgi:hypothetical protein